MNWVREDGLFGLYVAKFDFSSDFACLDVEKDFFEV